jgi:hypothetical protein
VVKQQYFGYKLFTTKITTITTNNYQQIYKKIIIYKKSVKTIIIKKIKNVGYLQQINNNKSAPYLQQYLVTENNK